MRQNSILGLGVCGGILAVVLLMACSDDSTTGGSSSGSTPPGTPTPPSGGSDSGSTTPPPSAVDSGADSGADLGEPTFTNVYSKVIAGTCTGCHAATHITGLAMGTKELAYTNLVGPDGEGVLAGSTACNDGTRKRVVPGDGDASLLWAKINHTPGTCGPTMPFGGGKIAQAKIDFVKAWIDAGAQND